MLERTKAGGKLGKRGGLGKHLKSFISLFKRAFKMMKKGVCFILIALLIAELCKLDGL